MRCKTIVTPAAMVGIAPGYWDGMKLDSGACQPSLQVVGAADRSFEFEVRAGGHQQRRCGSVSRQIYQSTAMVGIAPGNRVGMKLDSGACQPSLQVVGAADRSFEFEDRAGGHQQRRCGF